MSELSELLERNHFRHRCSICGAVEAERDRLIEERANARAEAFRAQERVRELREESRWIPVTERLPESLPESHRTVLVVQNGCVLARYYNTDKAAFVNSFGVKMDFVTHWRSLPKPPEVG